ncbi:hypothetical protein BDW75DRAFT_135664 [Aspergillus navahoensis]
MLLLELGSHYLLTRSFFQTASRFPFRESRDFSSLAVSTNLPTAAISGLATHHPLASRHFNSPALSVCTSFLILFIILCDCMKQLCHTLDLLSFVFPCCPHVALICFGCALPRSCRGPRRDRRISKQTRRDY